MGDILRSKLTGVSTSSVLTIRIILDVKSWRLFETYYFQKKNLKDRVFVLVKICNKVDH